MENDKSKRKKSIRYTLDEALGAMPRIEIEGNSRMSIEGCRGVLLYSQEEIKISMGEYAVSFFGKKLNLKYISSTSLVIEGFIKNIEFIV